jgi:hypothetical protein
MTLIEKFRNLFKGEYSPLDIIDYYRATYRYFLYGTFFKFLIRKHIQEQFEYRIKIMDKECYDNGECIHCGCSTPALQMTNKSCDGFCYPTMMTKKQWRMFNNYYYIEDLETGYMWKKYKDTNTKIIKTQIYYANKKLRGN